MEGCKCKPAKSFAQRIIEYQEFASLVKKMRDAQKDYQEWVASFDSRENIEYRKFKMERFESEVDEYLKKMEDLK